MRRSPLKVTRNPDRTIAPNSATMALRNGQCIFESVCDMVISWAALRVAIVLIGPPIVRFLSGLTSIRVWARYVTGSEPVR